MAVKARAVKAVKGGLGGAGRYIPGGMGAVVRGATGRRQYSDAERAAYYKGLSKGRGRTGRRRYGYRRRRYGYRRRYR